MRWSRHITQVGKTRKVYRILVRNLEGTEQWVELELDRRIQQRILKIRDERIWIGLNWLKTGISDRLILTTVITNNKLLISSYN
jgi:hypothetical protein